MAKDSDGDFDNSDPMLDRANRGGGRMDIITPQRSHINGKLGDAARNPDKAPEVSSPPKD